MKKTVIVLGSLIMLLSLASMANATRCVDEECLGDEFVVYAYWNSVAPGAPVGPLNTGLLLNVGDLLTVDVDTYDYWAAGSGERISNADGLDNFTPYSYDGLTAKFGTLVGRIGATGDYFVIGTSFSSPVTEQGNLYLGYWDINYRDNFGSITACVEVDPIPEPTTMLLFGTGLAGLAAVARRRK